MVRNSYAFVCIFALAGTAEFGLTAISYFAPFNLLVKGALMFFTVGAGIVNWIWCAEAYDRFIAEVRRNEFK